MGRSKHSGDEGLEYLGGGMARKAGEAIKREKKRKKSRLDEIMQQIKSTRGKK